MLKNFRIYFLVTIDILLIVAAIISSFYILFGNLSLLISYWWFLPLSIAFFIGTFRNFGLYHWDWQYISIHEVYSLIKAVALSSIFIAVSIMVFGVVNFPFSALIINAVFCFSLVGGLRLAIRIWKESKAVLPISRKDKRILIVGAGDAGEMILSEMLKLPKLGYRPIGFVDDSLNKKGTYIHQFPVLGKCSDLPLIIKDYEVDEVIIAIPTANRQQVRKIVGYCEEAKSRFRIVPGIYELIDGTAHINQIRNVELDDLLRREEVVIDMKEISSFLSGASVLITGAGGSIGSELCRQVARFNPAKIILLGKGENSVFDIENELKKNFPYLMIVTQIADIRDRSRIENIFISERPEVVFHAAAHKHVGLMERNPDEAVLNNILGTRNMVDISDKYNVREFVMISTDKAVNPSSIMGATKRVAEMIIQAKVSQGSKTKYVSVRFGNVLGSRGSVVPIFKRQIAEGGPVTVSHPEAKRYFMTIPEAVQLVIQSAALGKGGEVFILDMGEPVKIYDLAKDLIQLSGLEEGVDIEIKFVGLRPGEKLFEEILTAEEGAEATKHQKIFVASLSEVDTHKLTDHIKILENLAHNGKCAEIKQKLKEIIPTYKETII